MKNVYKIAFKLIIDGTDYSRFISSFTGTFKINTVSNIKFTCVYHPSLENVFLGSQGTFSVIQNDVEYPIIKGRVSGVTIEFVPSRKVSITLSDALSILQTKTFDPYSEKWGGAFLKALQSNPEEAIKFLLIKVGGFAESDIVFREDYKFKTLMAPISGVAENAGLSISGWLDVGSEKKESIYDYSYVGQIPIGKDVGITYYTSLKEGSCNGYEKLIQTYSAKYGFDPFIVAAICWNESSCTPSAVNENKNEYGQVTSKDWGIMQVNDYYYLFAFDLFGFTENGKVKPEVFSNDATGAENGLKVGCYVLNYKTTGWSSEDKKNLELIAKAWYGDSPGLANYTNRLISYYKKLISESEEGEKSETEAPVNLTEHPIVEGGEFGAQREGYIHKGVDLLASVGTPILAPDNGVCVAFRWENPNDYSEEYSMNDREDESYGNYILYRVDSDSIYYYLFAHLSDINGKIKAWGRGDLTSPPTFNKGEVLAYSGGEQGKRGSGLTTGPHIHMELAIGEWKSENKIDPINDPRSPISESSMRTVNPYLTTSETTDEIAERKSTVSAVDIQPIYYQSAYEVFAQLCNFGIWDYYASPDGKIHLIRQNFFQSPSGEIDPGIILAKNPLSFSYSSDIYTHIFITGNPFGEMDKVPDKDVVYQQAIGMACIFDDPELKAYFRNLNKTPSTRALMRSVPLFRTKDQCEEYAKYLLKKYARFYLSGVLNTIFCYLNSYKVYKLTLFDKTYTGYLELNSIDYSGNALTMSYTLSMVR